MFNALKIRRLRIHLGQPFDCYRVILIMLLSVGFSGSSKAGPPLFTDDPGILEPGSWEVILAAAAEECDESRVTHLPILDVSLGVTRNSQISLVLPYTKLGSAGGDSIRGLTFGTMGYKWRFISTSKWEWAIAANYSFPMSHEVVQKNGPADMRLLNVPVVFSRALGDWTWNGQLGWNVSSDGGKFWDYGISLSHPMGSSAHWMMEVFGFAGESFEQSSVNYQVGLDYELSPAIHVLVSAGTHLGGSLEAGARLNYAWYAGLQLFF